MHREREKDNFKSRKVNCLKECALALTIKSHNDIACVAQHVQIITVVLFCYHVMSSNTMYTIWHPSFPRSVMADHSGTSVKFNRHPKATHELPKIS